MKPKERLRAGGWSVAALLVAAGVGGCAYSGKGPIDEHYAKYKAGMPEGDKVFVCSSYGCRKQTPFKFTAADIAEVKKIMSAKRTATPAGEREATKAALAWMGHRADTAVGTAGDRPGDDMAGNGDPGQMDCVDVATNLSSYALVMERHKLFRHHSVGSMHVKEDIRRGFDGWTHYAGALGGDQERAEVRRRRLAAGQRQAAGDRRGREVVHRRQRHPVRHQERQERAERRRPATQLISL